MPGQSWPEVVERARIEHAQAKRGRTMLFAGVFIAVLFASAWVGEVRIGSFIEGIPGFFNYINDIAPVMHARSLGSDLQEWYWALDKWLMMLLDTVVIAFTGTALGAIGAFVFCFPASRNLMNTHWLYFGFRRLTEFCRSVPELVWAMLFVFSFGIGPFAGVLALAIHTAGALGKLFSEVNENVDMKSLEGVKASGGNWYQMIRYAVVPQVLPNFLSYTLLRFEVNVRAASVIGFVGAGGIGQELMFVIRQFVYTDISAIVLLIIFMVSLIDISCEHLRHRIIHMTGGQ
ncbi:phosphonate ABC transporter, permease protein PhnE [Oceanidesulfovibrio marinus]|uniref:Phosphonate ABC transporter, permease protein PhnE n=1 Tax=Oceanidesulfovibrio marinus TaxID=370038 RepID=A0ABX6ND05_9BACT|nr:phosphonate ABC transporter, permease protein PhnE [Oceanidesulfovibrio marinus]QJT07943.1 phosphonate ABC transporter, permease protein PhnE [Oceanidesulfovibrio marinus]